MLDFNASKGISRTLLGLSCFLLSSCALNETQYESKLNAPSSYGEITNPVSKRIAKGSLEERSQVTPDFYLSFKDNKLNEVISQALEFNYDLRSAYLNLRKAQVELGLANSNLHPTVNASIDSSSSKDLSQSSSSNRNANGNFSISYEADLFGRLDAQERGAYELFKASAYDYKAIRLSVIQRTSQYYWDYAYALEALKMAKEQLNDSQKRLDLIAAMRDQGVTDGLEYDQALVNHRNVEQMVYQRGYELTAAHNALATLLGLNSEENLATKIQDQALETTVSPEISLLLPSSLLQERPDLMAYEARVRAAYAQVDTATANFYPRFNLNAALGTGTQGSLTNFLVNPIGSLGAALSFPFFNYNELSLQKEGALIEREQASLDFAQGFIQAAAEVSDSINQLSYQEQLLRSTSSEYKLTKSNYQRYEERYRYGSASLSDLLDASDSLRNAQIKLLSAKRDLLNSAMHLMIALGGGSFSKEAVQKHLQQQSSDPQVILEEAQQSFPQLLSS